MNRRAFLGGIAAAAVPLPSQPATPTPFGEDMLWRAELWFAGRIGIVTTEGQKRIAERYSPLAARCAQIRVETGRTFTVADLEEWA